MKYTGCYLHIYTVDIVKNFARFMKIVIQIKPTRKQIFICREKENAKSCQHISNEYFLHEVVV